jgi:hypothetical protein
MSTEYILMHSPVSRHVWEVPICDVEGVLLPGYSVCCTKTGNSGRHG